MSVDTRMGAIDGGGRTLIFFTESREMFNDDDLVFCLTTLS